MESTHLLEGIIEHFHFYWLQKTKDSLYYHKPIVDIGCFFLEPIHHSNCHRVCIVVYSFHFNVFFFLKLENGPNKAVAKCST